MPFLFLGCTKTTAFTFFDMSKEFEHSIANSQSSRIVDEHNRSAIIVNATYLNRVFEDRYRDEEKILISTYIVDDSKICEVNSTTAECYELNLNAQAPINIEKIEYSNELIKTVPIKESWFDFYLVSFKKVDETTLKFKISNDKNSSIIMKFEKE